MTGEIPKARGGIVRPVFKAGYYVSGAGKIYHQMDVLNEEWSDYMDKGNYPGTVRESISTTVTISKKPSRI